MNKQEFVTELKSKLGGLPTQDVEERIDFYLEMIDDRIEDGCTEEEAIEEIGSVDEIAAQVIADIPLTRIAKERIKPKKRISAWEIVLLVLGSPIWLSLAVAAFVVILAIYVSIWSVVAALWAVFASLAVCAFGGAAVGAILICHGNTPTGIALIGAGIICAGLSVFLFFGCCATTKGIALLTKKIALGIKKCFVKKENA